MGDGGFYSELVIYFLAMYCGIHLATSPMSIALCDDAQLLYGYNSPNRHHAAEYVIEELHAACVKVGKTFSDLQAIGVTQGPGQYTGLRLSMAMANTIAQICECSIYGFDTLEMLVRPYVCEGQIAVVSIPARKGMYNAALFTQYQQQLKRVTPNFLLEEHKFYEKIATFQEPVIVLTPNFPSDLGIHTWKKVDLQASTVAQATRQRHSETPQPYAPVFPVYAHHPVE